MQHRNICAAQHLLKGLMALAVVGMTASAATGTIGPRIIIDGLFQQSTNTTSLGSPIPGDCNPSSLCYFLFAPAPSGKQLIVTQVSCTLFVSTGELHSAILRIQRPDGSFVDTAQFLTPTKTAETRFAVNTTTLALIDKKLRPVLEVQATVSAQIFGSCAIAGQIIVAP